ncbi:MAG: alpha/beta hydrolase [Betaproteobacteria bacterium]
MSAEIGIPEDLRRLMTEVGPKWATNVPGHVKQMVEAFSHVLARCPKDGVTVRRDVPYGTHARHVLDVYAPRDAKGAPVVVFVHGGAFTDGEKDRSPEVYGNVLMWFARHGIVGVNMEYRAAPEAQYPAGTEDVRAACQWVEKNATSLGVDMQRLFVFGHSAGAAHSAAYAYGAPGSEGGPKVAGSIVVSGRVRADNLPTNPNARKVEAYYGTDATLFEERSALHLAGKGSVPTFIAIAQYENPLLDVYCLELAHKLGLANGRAPRLMQLWGHNHTSIIAHINTAEDALGKALVEFVRNPGK